MKPGIAMLPVISRRARLGLLERGALLLAAAVVPEDGGAQRLVGGVEQRRAVHLAGEAHGLAPPCAGSAGSALTAALVALHQSAGFCSDHPACGRETLSGADACSTTVSLSSTRTALTLDVPISMPRYIRPLNVNKSCPKCGGNATRNIRTKGRRFRAAGPSSRLPIIRRKKVPSTTAMHRPRRTSISAVHLPEAVARLARQHPLRIFARAAPTRR